LEGMRLRNLFRKLRPNYKSLSDDKDTLMDAPVCEEPRILEEYEPEARRLFPTSSSPGLRRVCVTCDGHGMVIVASSFVKDMFGRAQEELCGTSVKVSYPSWCMSCDCSSSLSSKSLLQPASRRVTKKSLSYRTDSERFSRSELWQSLRKELAAAKFVNGVHQDGHMFPLLLSVCDLKVGGIFVEARNWFLPFL
jgi:hypothetical protein